MKSHLKKYENTENFIKEESSDDNLLYTEDEDDYHIKQNSTNNKLL